ncbi:MAG: hypothetical protein MJ016_04705 [Victivallaceae bacterium]|nr:hypothetical protein [Victivallaceae bacterium]
MKRPLTALAAFLIFLSVSARETPWSAWRLAYSEFEKAEKSRDQGDYLHAAEGFKKALELYQSVRKARPDWNQRVILRRIDDCQKELRKIEHFLGPAPENSGAAPAAAPLLPAEVPPRKKSVAAPAETSPEILALRKKANDLELEVQTLRQKENARKNLESEITLLIRDQHLAKEKCALLEEKLRQAEKNAAAAENAATKTLSDQLLQLKIECESLKTQLAESREKIRTSENEAEKAVRQRKFAEKAVQAAQNDLRRIEAETQDLRRAEEENRGKRSELDNRIRETEAARAELVRELAAARSALDEAREKLRISAGDTQKAQEILAGENRKLSEKLAALQAKYDQLNEDFLVTKNDCIAANARAEQLKSIAERGENARQVLDRQNAALGKNADRLQRENTEQTETIARQKERIETLGRDLNAAVRQKENLEERLRQRDESDYRAAADIRTQRERWDAEREKLQQKIAESEAEIKKLTLRNQSTLEQLQTMTAAREKALADIAAMQEKIARTQALEESLAALRSNFIAAQNELKTARAELADADAVKKELALLRNRAAEVEILKSKLSEEQRLNSELAAANADLTLRATEAAKYKSEVEKLRAEVARTDELRATITRLQKLNAELAGKKDVEAELARAKQKLAEMEALRAENAAVRKQRDDAAALLADKERLLAEAETRLAGERETRSKNAALSEEIERMKKEIGETRRTAEKAETLRRETAEKLADAQRDAGEKQKKIDELAPLPAQLEKLREERRALLQAKAADADSAQLLHRQQEKLDALQKTLDRAEETVRRLEKENAAKPDASAVEKLARQKDDEIGRLQETLRKQTELLHTTEQKRSAGEKENALLLRRAADAEAQLLAQKDQSQRQLEQLQTELRLAREETEKMRSLNAELVQLKTQEKQLEILRARLAEAERYQSENLRLRQLNEELRKENASLNLTVLKPTAERRYEFDSASALMASSDVLIATGMRAESEGRTATAVWNYENALKKSPRNAMAARKLGLLLLRREEFERAEKVLVLAARLAPDDREVALGAAIACNRCRRYGIALAFIEPMLKDDAPDMQTLLAAAEAYEGSGKRAKAETLLRFARSRFPDDFATGIALAKFLAKDVGGEDEALRLYESLRLAGAPPEPELEIRFSGRLDERRELALFFQSAAEEAAAKADWQTVLWYRRRLAELQRDEKTESAQLAFARYMTGDTAAALEEISLRTPGVEGELVAALCHLREHDAENFRQSVDRVKNLQKGKSVRLDAEWRFLLLELKKNALTAEGRALLDLLP